MKPTKLYKVTGKEKGYNTVSEIYNNRFEKYSNEYNKSSDVEKIISIKNVTLKI